MQRTGGRPQLFENSHAISVIVPKRDYEALRRRVDEIQFERPGYSLGDLIRELIERDLGLERRPVDRRAARVRQLRSLQRVLGELVKECAKTA